jgi:hypothetical protein
VDNTNRYRRGQLLVYSGLDTLQSDELALLKSFYAVHPNEKITIEQSDTVGYDPDNYPKPPGMRSVTSGA